MRKISVVIPTYNGAEVIPRCLNSLRRQEGAGKLYELEIIAADDHSSDGTWELLRAEKDVIALRTPRNTGGPSAGRNLGLEAAAGDFIALIDQDDEWHPAKLQRQLELIDRAALVFCDFDILDQLTGKTDYFSDRSGKVLFYEPNQVFLRLLRWEKDSQNPLALISSLLFHRDLKRIRFEENFGVCDFDYLLKLTAGQPAARICVPLITRHVYGSNLSLNPYFRRVAHYHSLMTLEEYEDRYPKEVALAARRINGTYARYFYKIGRMKKARKYFRRSQWNWKTLGYIITSYFGANWVKKHFRIFGS